MPPRTQTWKEMSAAPRSFIAVVVLAGLPTLTYTLLLHGWGQSPLKFLCYLVIALAASRLKVNLPGISGTMSVNFLFLLLGVLELSLSETMALGFAAVVVQCIGRERTVPIQVSFNTCSTALAIAVTFFSYRYFLLHSRIHAPVLLFAAACIYFVANTLPVAIVISLTERRPLHRIWSDCYFWSFPYYLVGAGVVGMMSWLHNFTDWQTSLLILPVVYLIYRSYRLYLGKLEDEKRHVEEMADLHMRTIEALALAIEAKDQTTHDHLQRVRIYAVEVAKELKVDEAALLRRIENRIAEMTARGEALRPDDNPEVLHRRLGAYREQTAPLIAYYRAHGILRSVDGMAPIAEVARQIEGALGDAANTPEARPATKPNPAAKPAIGKKSKARTKRASDKPRRTAGKRRAAKARSKVKSRAGTEGKSQPKGRKAKARPKTKPKTRARKRPR